MQVQTPAAYLYRHSTEPTDPAWDRFLQRTPGGHHVQTSVWAYLKDTMGWRTHRVVVAENGEVVGGAQLLIHPFPVGAIGYVPKGPVLAKDDPALTELVLREIRRVAGQEHIVHLTVQPPNAGPNIVPALVGAGYSLGDTDVAPTASVQIDLAPDLDDIFAKMKKNHRRYIRHGLRQGMTGRRGTRDDLATFHELLVATAQRQGFSPYPLSYFTTLWDLLDGWAAVELFLTEYEGKAVSAQLAIGFGDTVYTKNSGWSGEYPSLAPNHVLEWTTIQWAKANGFHTYDLEGIEPAAARIIASGNSLPPEMTRRPFFWKLGFGGDVVLFPQPYVLIPNPGMRKLYSVLYPRAARWPITAKLVNRFRTG